MNDSTHPFDLETLILAKGAHNDRSDGLCLLEAVAWWAGETHTDQPACVSPILGAYGRAINDLLPHDKRQQLRQLIPLLPGTAADGLDETRSYAALDWLIRTWIPTWLDLAALKNDATALRRLHPITDLSAARSARPVVQQASQNAAGRPAAWATAGDAAWATAGDAAWAAAWAAAGDVAGDAAWAAAGDAAWAAAGDAAWDAAWAAAWDAAWTAARDAGRDAGWGALAPTVAILQDSAIVLYQTMIEAA
jgi:hypothetical protein